MTPTTDAATAPLVPRKKPRLALAIATVFGVGYAPKAPGTFGSLAGVVLSVIVHPMTILFLLPPYLFGLDVHEISGYQLELLLFLPVILVFLVVALIGVWAASSLAFHTGLKDPQQVVIDEVSGQHFAFMLALASIGLPSSLGMNLDFTGHVMYFAHLWINWKYLLLGFILFRVFDIWKPWPIRRLERLPGGWGIMADDWMAGIYAAILLRLALHFSLV